MPGNILFSDIAFPQIGQGDDVEQSLKKILNYQFMLNEQLRYSLYNLGEENFNQVEWDNLTEPIYASIGDAESVITELALTSEGLGLRVSDAEKGIAELTVTAQGLASQISDTEGNLSALTQTVNSIGFTVTSSTSDGQTSSLLQMTKNGVVIGSGVIDATSAAQAQSLIDVSIDNLSLGVTNSNGYSRITLESGSTTIATSGRITLGGEVVFVGDLEDGTTIVDGGCIRTGTIDASTVSVEDAFEVLHNGSPYGYMGYGTGSNTGGETQGIIMEDWSGDNYFIATGGGVRMQSGECIYCTAGGDIVASVPIEDGSDRRIKKDISYDMSRYKDMFLALKPCFFRLVNGSSGRNHTGFIAQEMEEAILNNGLTTMDVASLVKDPNEEGYSVENPFYRIRYSEMIALNTYMIQQLWNRVDELINGLQ